MHRYRYALCFVVAMCLLILVYFLSCCFPSGPRFHGKSSSEWERLIPEPSQFERNTERGEESHVDEILHRIGISDYSEDEVIALFENSAESLPVISKMMKSDRVAVRYFVYRVIAGQGYRANLLFDSMVARRSDLKGMIRGGIQGELRRLEIAMLHVDPVRSKMLDIPGIEHAPLDSLLYSLQVRDEMTIVIALSVLRMIIPYLSDDDRATVTRNRAKIVNLLTDQRSAAIYSSHRISDLAHHLIDVLDFQDH